MNQEISRIIHETKELSKKESEVIDSITQDQIAKIVEQSVKESQAALNSQMDEIQKTNSILVEDNNKLKEQNKKLIDKINSNKNSENVEPKKKGRPANK